MAEIIKTSDGYVTQAFDENGKCLWQKFTAGNSEIEQEFIDELNVDSDSLYFPFDMVQPE